ncbi:MAG: ATP-binding cassette domain-containing protein [Gammaproteobacteria bacterium]|nr:ATP-binding cassette domain-containing protein [Gammaproteobacteria bacterium]
MTVLKVDNIKKRFGELEVLHGLSLSANSGDVISLVGSSGSGKSTFLRCINLLEMPDEGEISLTGEAIDFTYKKGLRVAKDERQVQKLRSRIGMVFQQFNLWSHMTVFQNVTEAPIKCRSLDQYPSLLSGGQQQRAAIARALAMQPEVLLFDEPTSALDPELVGEVLMVMRQLAQEGTTMIVVTHEMAFARDVCNRVLFLHDGLIEEQGNPNQVFTSPRSDRLKQFLSKTNAAH